MSEGVCIDEYEHLEALNEEQSKSYSEIGNIDPEWVFVGVLQQQIEQLVLFIYTVFTLRRV